MPVGKRINLHSLVFHYNLASHWFLSLSSPLIFTTLNVSPSTPGDHLQLPLWHLCVLPEPHSWPHQFCSQCCASTCVPCFRWWYSNLTLWPKFKSSGQALRTSFSPSLNAKMCTYLYTHAHTLRCLLTLVNSLSWGLWNPCLHPVPHRTDLIQLLLSQSFSEYLPRVYVPGVMKDIGVTVNTARVLLESSSESSAVSGGFL